MQRLSLVLFSSVSFVQRQEDDDDDDDDDVQLPTGVATNTDSMDDDDDDESVFQVQETDFVQGQRTATMLSSVLAEKESTDVKQDDEREDDVVDDYDDWFADFDPSDYDEILGKSSSSSRDNAWEKYEEENAADDRYRNHHGYVRDYDADSSNVDEEAVDRLIVRRSQARMVGDYRQADDIRDQLLEDHGVAIFDRQRVYRTGCSTSGSGLKWRPNDSTTSSRRKTQQQQQQGKGRRNRRNDFGPHGHDYHLSPEAGPNCSGLTEHEIHALLAERLQCKLNRNFDDADDIQDELLRTGVNVHDGMKEWRADGKGFERQQTNGRHPRRIASYTQTPTSQNNMASEEDVETIQDLVDRRMEAKRQRDYHVADDIREELLQEFNVYIDDRKNMWSVGGDFGDHGGEGRQRQQTRRRDDLSMRYTMSPTSAIPENAAEIQARVEERNDARRIRDYDTADEILDDLLEQDIVIDDTLRQWSVRSDDDDFDDDTRKRSTNTDHAPFVKRGAGGDLSTEDETLIEQLLQERSQAQRDRAFGKADRIRDRLQADFRIRIDDRAREWHVVSDKYAMNPPSSELNADLRVLIEERIVERSVAKLERDYETADAIRDELAEVYGVEIDDRVREWRIVGAPPALREDDVEDYDEDDVLPTTATDSIYDDESAFQVQKSDFKVVETDKDESVDPSNAQDKGTEYCEEEENNDNETMDDDRESLQALTIPELKVRLRAAGLPVSGRKAELIERLIS